MSGRQGSNHKNVANSSADNHKAFENHRPAQRDSGTLRRRQEPWGEGGNTQRGPTKQGVGWGAGDLMSVGRSEARGALGAFLI